MPVYQYICPECKTEFEQRENFHDTASAQCPRCSSRASRKFSPVPVFFKGSGFYCTDHPKGS